MTRLTQLLTPTAPLDLEGRTALVTGAASGIGAATTRLMVARGARVTMVDRSTDQLAAMAEELGERVLPVPADVTDRAALDAAVTCTRGAFGPVEVCFANAGISASPPATVRSTTDEAAERILEIDLLGVWRTVRAVLPDVAAHAGHVVLSGSIYSFYNGAVNAPYAMSKAGVEALGRALRAELAGTGATAGVVYPGWVRTPVIEPSRGNAVTAKLLEIGFPGPLNRVIEPEDVARVVVRSVERRSPQAFAPREWAAVAAARGVLNPLVDEVLDRHRRAQAHIRELDDELRVTP